MTPVIPCSFGSVTLLTKTAFSPRKEIHLAKCSVYRRFSKSSVTTQRLFLSQPTSLKLLQNYGGHSSSKNVLRIRSLSAVGTDVATEEQNPAASDEVSDEIPDVSPEPSATNDASASPVVTPTARSKYPRSTRKSNMPPVKNEELVPGASFTGKVRSIQPFGAFIDFGAFTDGLVHVSKLSDGFVKDVGTVVSVGQEVKVRIVEVNMESSRISLTMRESDDANKPQQRKEAFYGGENERPRTSRRNAARSNQKTSKFVKGQVLDGTVKNLTRSGAFVSLPEGEEGFIPIAEESEGFGNILGSSSLQVGQEVNVRVLRITRGQVTLTMKKEEDVEAINKQLNQGVVHTATNPFVLAFRRNKDISSFLEEREKVKQSAETLSSKPVEEKSDEVLLNESDVPALERSSDVSGVPASEEPTEQAAIVDSASSEVVTEEEVPKSTVAGTPQEDLSSLGASGNSESSTDSVLPEEASIEAEADQEYDGADISPNSLAQGSDTFIESAIPEATNEAVEPATSDNDDNGSVALTTEKSDYAADLSVDGTAGEVEEKEAGSRPEIKQEDEVVSREPDANQIADTLVVEENVESQKPAENVVVSATSTSDVLATSSSVEETAQAASDGQSTIAVQDSSSKASISPALVKELREETGAGMMDCKKALAETGGDIIKAQEFLRKKGLASADKKASRATAEGRIGSYIHDNRIGVLIEVNCETDFVSRGDIFKELVDDLAMQVAACPQVQYLVTEDVPEEIVSKEREIEMQKEDLLSKPEQIRSKIVDGRIKKRLDELALLEQAYIKNDKLVVKDLVKQTIATIGENIKVKRFVRYNLGEGLEKKSQDFAAEVAAQTTATAPPQVPKSQPAATQESGETATTVAVSAALVKELREVTGAGMMDCKKALSETGGDLEKAQEYLRKKGLSSADKKSSRLAAEGRISSYIHDSRIGVLIEVNCETDFVARNEKFRELVDDLAMQVVACPQVEFVSIEEIPKSIVSKEKEIEMQREDLKSKPENIREKIVEGRVSKRLGELALLEQPFIKDDNVLVKDLVKQTVAALGENIRVRRFVRFTIGE